MKEMWKSVVGYENLYEVSNLGRIKSLDRVVKNNFGTFIVKSKILTPNLTTRSYYKITFCYNGKNKTDLVHRVVAKAFLENALKKPMVNHKNGIKSDNRLENLEWVTSSENINHALDTGLITVKKGEKLHFAKITDYQASLIKGMYYNDSMSIKEITLATSLKKRTVADLVRNRTWRHIPTPNKNSGEL